MAKFIRASKKFIKISQSEEKYYHGTTTGENDSILKSMLSSGIDPKIAKLIPIPLIAPLSFLSLKYFVFKGNKKFLSKNQGVS